MWDPDKNYHIKVCSGNGFWQESNSIFSLNQSDAEATTDVGGCVCYEGWKGDWCNIAADECGVCLNGQCINGECKCTDGYTGAACDHKRCPADCSGNGVCIGGLCRCYQGTDWKFKLIKFSLSQISLH